MKNILTACLPALALLALGGCASTSAVTSSEDDGVYYSSKDRTTAIVSAAPAPASTDEAANPDYRGNTAKSSPSSGSDQYYDNSYTYMKGVPSYGPGLSYYTPYSPYTTLSYSYGWGAGACGLSPYPCLPSVYSYGLYDPFYSPFYSPYYGYGYGSGLSITFGFGRSWGYGGYYGYGRPYYAYGGFYDPYYYSGPFYGGYYGRGGYYGNTYYGSNNAYYGNDNSGRGRTSGHRSDRSSEGRNATGVIAGGAGNSPSAPSGGRVRSELRTQPAPETMPSQSGVIAADGGRTRTEAAPASPAAEQASGGFNRPRSIDREQPQYRNMDQPLPGTAGRQREDVNMGQGQGEVTRETGRGRWRNTDAAPQGGGDQGQMASPQPEENRGRRRGGFFQSFPSEPNNGGQTADQSRQRSYEQPQRTYEQPQQRTYEQPQQRTYERPQQRTYEQPTYSQPSYSAPSNSGGGGGGGRSRGRAD